MKKLIFIFFIILTCINADDISDIDKLIDINITDINKTASLRSEIGKIDCFQKNDFESCRNMAYSYYKYAGNKIKKSILAYHTLCKITDLDSCYDSLMIQDEFKDFYGYSEKGIRDNFAKVCQKNHKPSCDRVNNKTSDNKLLTKNKDGEENLEIARFLFNMSYEIYNLGCQRDDYDSCLLLGTLIEEGIGDSNKKRVFEKYNLGCERGHEYSCRILARLIKKGIADSNKKRAFEIYEKECKKGKDSYPCVLMAVGYMNGDIVEKDTKKAEGMLKNLCDKNEASACFYLSKLQNNDKDKEFYLEKSCKLNDGIACSMLGEYYYEKKDYKKALDLLEKECKTSMSADACYYSAKSLENIDKEKNKEKIELYYYGGCIFDNLNSCMEEKKYGK